MTRKFLREMLDEARSKDQQIKGQRAMLDQKIKAEYDKLTKEVPSPSQRRKKKRVTDIQESDWTPISGPGPTNSASQSFQHFSGSTVTVSGLGGVESTPSTVTIGFEGETFDVAAPTYNQLAMQGYAPPLPMLKRRDNVNVNARLDASQEFARNVNSDVFMNARPPALRDYRNVPLGDIAKDHGVKDAKDVFDYYMNWAENPNSNPVNLTNKISPESQAYLQKLSGEPSVQGLTGTRKAEALNQLYVRDLNNGSIPRGLRNILGMPDRNKGDGFNVDKNGNVTVSKAYDFTNITDIGGADIITGLAAGLYAAGKGIMKHFDGGKESPTMNININVAAPSANANSLGQRGPDGGMTDAQIKAAQDKVNADRRAGKMSDIRGSEANKPYTFDSETGEPKYTGMDDQQLNDAYNKISDKYNDLRAPLEKQLRDLAGQEAPQSIIDKINELNDAQTAEEEALRAEREAQENEFNDALKDYFDKQDAENKARQDALDEIDAEEDPYSDLLGRLGAELEKLKREGKAIKKVEIVGPGEEGYVDTTDMANAIGYNRRIIYTAAAIEIQKQIDAAQDAQMAWINSQQKKRDAVGGQGGLPLGSTTRRGGSSGNNSQASSIASQASSAVGLNPQQRRKRGIKESTWDKMNRLRNDEHLPVIKTQKSFKNYINEISGAALIKSARKAKNETDTLRAKLEPGYKNKRTRQMHKFAISGVKKLRSEVEEDYKNLPRDRMAKQYDRKKDKNYDEFHKQNPMGIGPRVSRGKSDTQIDQHGNSRQTKAISGQLKNNPRFYDSSHEQWQRMQSKFKSQKNSDATGEVARRLNPPRKKKKL